MADSRTLTSPGVSAKSLPHLADQCTSVSRPLFQATADDLQWKRRQRLLLQLTYAPNEQNTSLIQGTHERTCTYLGRLPAARTTCIDSCSLFCCAPKDKQHGTPCGKLRGGGRRNISHRASRCRPLQLQGRRTNRSQRRQGGRCIVDCRLFCSTRE